jgi:translation initiation factor 3 subunit E
MTAAPAPTEDASTYDLTSQISPHLDLHMIFPLLEYLDSLISSNSISYSSADVAAARLSLLKPTHMVDYAMDIYREVNGSEEVPKEMEEQKERVFRELEELREGAGRMDELFRNEELRVSLDVVGMCTSIHIDVYILYFIIC